MSRTKGSLNKHKKEKPHKIKEKKIEEDPANNTKNNINIKP